MFIGFALAGYCAPAIMSVIYDKNNSYNMAFLVSICLAITGILLSLVCESILKKCAILSK